MTPRALLIHGLQSSPASWRRVAAWLREAGWAVHTPTLIGHGGRGPADDYSFGGYAVELEGDSGWDLVVGHSLGGAVATTLAARDPRWTDRLALIDPALLVPREEREPLVAGLIAEHAATAESLRAEFPSWTEEDVAAKVAGLTGSAPDLAELTVAANDPWDVRAEVAAVSAPLLLITGDPAVFTMDPPALVETLAAANPGIRAVTIVDAGHSPHRDRPDAVRDALLGWIAETDARG